MNTLYISKHQQQGAVLVVSLLILMVLTLIGISSMNGSIMEEKMASNAQSATTTFQQAESAVRQTFYIESRNPAQAVANARNDKKKPVDYSNESLGIDSNTQMTYPTATVTIPVYNSSAGFIAHGIEITGTASIGYIKNKTTQGYYVYPMMPES